MKNLLRWLLGLLFITPALWLGYFTIYHIRMLYFQSDHPYFFGLILKFGTLKIYDPWSAIISLVSVLLLIIAGLATILNSKKKILIQAAAVVSLGIFILGSFLAA